MANTTDAPHIEHESNADHSMRIELDGKPIAQNTLSMQVATIRDTDPDAETKLASVLFGSHQIAASDAQATSDGRMISSSISIVPDGSMLVALYVLTKQEDIEAAQRKMQEQLKKDPRKLAKVAVPSTWVAHLVAIGELDHMLGHLSIGDTCEIAQQRAKEREQDALNAAIQEEGAGRHMGLKLS